MWAEGEDMGPLTLKIVLLVLELLIVQKDRTCNAYISMYCLINHKKGRRCGLLCKSDEETGQAAHSTSI